MVVFKQNFILFSLCFLAVACSKETEQVSCSDGLRDLCLSTIADFKSTFASGGSSVVWTEGDRMSVLDGKGNRKFISTSTSESALFIGKVDAQSSALTVVYPYNQANALGSGNTISAILPTNQWAVKGCVSDEAILAVGRSDVSSPFVNLKNVVGFVSLSIPSGMEEVTRIDFSSNSGEILSGMMNLIYDGSSAPVVSSSSGENSVSLITPNDGLPAGEYFLTANPVTLTGGFTLTFHRSDGKVARIGSLKSNTITRNKLLELGLIDAAKLSWETETLPKEKKISIDFSSWPFDQFGGTSKFVDVNSRYVTGLGGMAFDINGEAYYKSSAFVVSSNYSTLSLPAVSGCRLSSVVIATASGIPNTYFRDSDGKPVSVRHNDNSVLSSFFRIVDAPLSGVVSMVMNGSVSISRIDLNYEIVNPSAAEVISVGDYDGSSSSFSFKNASSSDFTCGIEYVPSGSEDWTNSQIVQGTITSSSSTSACFTASVPDGAYKVRAWARPSSLDAGANRFSKIYYTPSSQLILSLDFSKGVLFTKSGTEKTGAGSFEDPRKGLDFPTGKQVVLSQETGETSNDGSSRWGTYRDFTGYLSNYPIAEFKYSEGGKSYTFLLGTGQGGYNAYMYQSNGILYSNKANFMLPGLEGYRVKSVVFNMTASGQYAWKYGIGSSSTNVGETCNTTADNYLDIAFNYPVNITSGACPNLYSSNSYYIKKMTLIYVKD